MKSVQRFLLSALIVFLGAFNALGQRRERTIDTWRPLHYDVNLTFDDQLTQLTAARTDVNVEVLASTVFKIDLDFAELPIDSVLISGKPAKFESTAETLNVLLPTPAKRGNKLDITINYHGRPKDGLILAKDTDGNPSATGDNWPNRVHYWIPSLDHPSAKATVAFTVSTPQRYQVVANGKFITLTGNAATSHWRYDETKAIPPYCMIVAVNQGVIIKPPYQSTTSLLFNVPQRDREYAPKGFSGAEPALAFFSQTIAPYPYEKLALIIGATQFGGMENSSAIVFTSTLFNQRAAEFNAPGQNGMSARFGIPTRIESVVAHEIAHQWFGDSVTESTWADLWLSEGFATYFAGLFIEKYDGQDAFRDYLERAAERYFAYEKLRSAPIHDTETVDLMKLLNPNNYEKGAWVLHMLRRRLGDDAFFKGLRAYYAAHAHANASTEDLRDALERTSGENLREFFQRWVYGSGHPVYEISQTRAGELLTITLKQTQPGEAFLDPVPIEIIASGKKIPLVIQPHSKITTARLLVSEGSTSIRVDPENTLLKQVIGK